jgi:hypothetical protein
LPGAVIRPEPGEWQPRMPERLDEEKLADWRADRDVGLSARRAGGSARGSRSPLHKPSNLSVPAMSSIRSYKT